MDTYLEQCSNVQKIIITTFATRVRTGYYSRGHTVRVPSITKALAAISKTIKLAGEQSPLYKTEKTYKTSLEWILEGFQQEDPPSTPQLALSVVVPEECQTTGTRSNNLIKVAIGDLVVIAFYYLLRVGDCTKSRLRVVEGKQSASHAQFNLLSATLDSSKIMKFYQEKAH